MNVGDLKAWLATLDDGMDIVREDVHPSTSPDCLREGDVDDYGGLGTGTYSRVWRSDCRVIDGQAVIG